MASNKRSIIGWALYDWANSAFATTVLAGLFPIFLRSYWHPQGVDDAVVTYRLGWAHSISAFAVAVLAPLLGALADRLSRRKLFIVVFAGIGIVSTATLYLVAQGQWLFALLMLGLAKIGFSCGNSFYDSLIVEVCEPEKRDAVSGLGYGLGYLGGGVLFFLNILMISYPEKLGLTEVEAVRWCFLSVAVWWGVFTIPLLKWVHERPADADRPKRVIVETLAQLKRTLRRIFKDKAIRLFLLAYFCYIDGINTIIEMAVDHCQAIDIQLKKPDMMAALLLVQLVGFPAAIAFSKLGSKIGTRKGILIGVIVYGFMTGWSYFMHTKLEFYGLAICVGLVQGGVQALSRSLFSRIIPAENASEYFGIYNILGKFAAVIGPALVGITAVTFGSRFGLLSLMPLFIAGGIFLMLLPDERVKGEPVDPE